MINHRVFYRQAIRIFLTGLLILLGNTVSADTVFINAVPSITISSAPSEPIGSSIAYFVDHEEKWTVDTLKTELDTPEWQQSKAGAPNLGLQSSPVWFALRLNTTQDLSRLLEISYPALNAVDIYLFDGENAVQAIYTGNGKPFDERPIKHRNYIVPLGFQANTPYVLIIRAQTGGALQLPVTLWEPNAFYNTDQVIYGAIMLFTGIMMAMAIYNLLLYVGLRETPYLWYVLTVVAVAWLQLAIRGIIFQYVWPEHPEFNEIGLTIVIALNVAFVAFFSDSFLNIRNTSVNASRAIRGIAWIGIALLVFSLFVPYAVAIRPLIVAGLISAPITFFVGIYLWYKGEILARFYVVAWGLFLAGITTYTLNKIGILPYTPLSEHAMIIGSCFQVLCISFALAYQINLEKRKRIEAQEEALQIQHESLHAQQLANEQLEMRVKERTEELEIAYREVKHLSQIDGLTKISNRQNFDQILKREWRRSRREVSHISLLMIDADYFKRINDSWGHPCGDACLQYIANICKSAVKRAGDTVARYGGEEFVLLLPSTDLVGGAIVAERIRKDIESTPLTWKNESISLTVSIGAASSIPEVSGSYEQLIQFSDEALYAAKAAGRNQVMVHQIDDNGEPSINRPPILNG